MMSTLMNSLFSTLILTATLVLVIIIVLPLPRPVLSGPEAEAIHAVLNRLDSQKSSPSAQESAARGVLKRLLPSHLHSFQFKIDICGGSSCFTINNYKGSSQNGPEIIIGGTTAVEIASGLHWYIKYWCGAHVSWVKTGGIQIASIPESGSLPLVQDGDSYVWWDWERWEKEIDWMALQASSDVHFPLLQKFNVTARDLDNFFGGPAFLAWARMGNLHGWGGPLSQNWLDQQLALQKKILSRMLELGMTPVLPSFSGNVPAALQKVFPLAKITRLGDWNTVDKNPRWCCTYLLDPSDSLFVDIGEAFIKQQIEEYGDVTDIYNCDTFNENSPPTNDPAYISSLGAAVYNAMSKGDKDAVWLMQGWLFYSDSGFWQPPQMQALLHSVPLGKMIVLDLFADVKPIWRTSSQFYGIPYVWCLLHNFGGNIEMYGILDAIASGPVEARISENSTMVGVGMCMEGIEQNPVVYELMSEMAFRSEKVHVLTFVPFGDSSTFMLPQEWLKTYSRRRYGKAVHQAEVAWEILYQTIYNCTDGIADHNKDFIVKFPDWDPSQNSEADVSKQDKMHILFTLPGTRRFLSEDMTSDFPQAHLWYSTQEVINALGFFIDAGNHLNGSLTYRYDLVDLTRQVLSKLANQVYIDAITAFRRKDAKALKLHGQKFVQLIGDIDLLLASDDNFLLGTWLESAKNLSVNHKEMKQYEWNARTQVTMWYDTTKTIQSKLHDYANKFWSGLLEDYYLPRASTYFDYLLKSLEENKDFKLGEWRTEWISFSNRWQDGAELYSVKARGDALAIAKTLYHKYFG
ncbi:hypothetical protein Tsubulata_007000 [Turnera subulata]|uniref:Alpha-N-acetylglucosaminidase n=1 Tax=Turnera subulata TaxID=218843 RepID=A0A9Q0F0J1_9ROSI|nr:hypothetical protein Tsubulata_007000 [Turnera subulata]